MHRRLKHHFLGQEPVEKRDPCHRQRPNHRNHRGDGHQVTQTAKPLDIAGMGFMVDNSHAHEQSGLKGQVVEDMKHRRNSGKFRAHPQEQGQKTQMADSREGQQCL